MADYIERFKRNLGVFTPEEQEKIGTGRVIIAGCGGIGGTVAVILARSGWQRFVLVDPDIYEPSNINRQIACFDRSIGKPKTSCVTGEIYGINPKARVTEYPRAKSISEIMGMVEEGDILFPAADDFAFSICLFREAQKQGIRCLFALPSGTWANVSMIFPESPPVEDIFGIPRLDTYEEIRELFEKRKYKMGAYGYLLHADWRLPHFRAYLEDASPLAQICPTVWLAASIGAMEVLKTATGKWPPVVSPKYWSVRRNRIRVQRINRLSLETLISWHRKVMWPVMHSPLGKSLEWTAEHIYRLLPGDAKKEDHHDSGTVQEKV